MGLMNSNDNIYRDMTVFLKTLLHQGICYYFVY